MPFGPSAFYILLKQAMPFLVFCSGQMRFIGLDGCRLGLHAGRGRSFGRSVFFISRTSADFLMAFSGGILHVAPPDNLRP